MAGSISTLGVGSGLELQSILEQLRGVDEQVTARKKTAVTTLESQLNEFTVVNNKLLTMKSAALNLSLSSSFIARTVSSSDESVLTATVADGTAVQSTSLTVDRLATKSTWMTGGNATRDAVINPTEADAVISYRVGEEESSLTVPSGTTLEGLADLINGDADNPGLTASIINDGSSANPYKLVLKSNTTGSESEISIDSPWMDIARHGATGEDLNAQVTVDGVAYQRQENTMSDVITGVSLSLQAPGTSSVAVANNNSALKDMIKELVTGYNDSVQEIAKNTGYDEETESFGILARTTLRDLPYALQNLMTSRIDTGSSSPVKSLFDLGLEFNRDGSISINETTLSAAIADSPEAVSAFFLGDEEAGITGMADKVNDYLRTLTSGTGQVAAEKDSVTTRISELQLKIETETARLDKRYEILTKQFVGLDRYMSQMKSMGNYLTGQFDSLGKMLSGGK